MSKIVQKILWVAVISMAVLYLNEKGAAEGEVDYAYFVNGGFESGDYIGWKLSDEDGSSGGYGTWSIATAETKINLYQDVVDECDQQPVTQCLTIPLYTDSATIIPTFAPTEGLYLAYYLQSGPSEARMYQDIVLPENATAISWDMGYQNIDPLTMQLSDTFVIDPNAEALQYLAVHIRDLNDEILQTLFITAPGSQSAMAMQSITKDVSMYAGMTIRVDVELKNHLGFFPVRFDNFKVLREEVATLPPAILPPGWAKEMSQRKWEGSPPGLEGKTPFGHTKENGKKTGWKKDKN